MSSQLHLLWLVPQFFSFVRHKLKKKEKHKKRGYVILCLPKLMASKWQKDTGIKSKKSNFKTENLPENPVTQHHLAYSAKQTRKSSLTTNSATLVTIRLTCGKAAKSLT